MLKKNNGDIILGDFLIWVVADFKKNMFIIIFFNIKKKNNIN